MLENFELHIGGYFKGGALVNQLRSFEYEISEMEVEKYFIHTESFA